MADEQLRIEVVCALPDRQRLVSLTMPAGSTARDAVRRANLQPAFPELDIDRCRLGVFGEAVDDGHALAQGDRVEIYHPLPHDPREKRRQLAARGEFMGRQRGSD